MTVHANTHLETHELHSASPHAHESGQITFVEQGAASLEAGGRVWTVPAGKLYWIPAGVVHSASHGPVHGWLMVVPQELTRHLPDDVCVLKASPLLLAALDRMRSIAPKNAMLAPLTEIVAQEIASIGREAPGLTLPHSPRMHEWALCFLANPNVKIGINQAAAAVAMSRRSFTRHFEHEVGLSFALWKRAVIVHHAIERLAQGMSVGDIAYEAGNENVSAFIAMFKASCVSSPRAFQESQRLRQR
jgi:AraC-like DNA-binding protein